MAEEAIFDAVTAVLVCGDEFYMVRRQAWLAAFPGYQAFPGGRVDDADRGGETPPQAFAAFEPALARALIREIDEELGLDLRAACAAGVVEAVRPLARALTPPGGGRRFDTHFFLIRLRDKPALKPDTKELADGAWGDRNHWLGRYLDGDLLLAPPTRIVLSGLSDLYAPPFIDCNAQRGFGDPPLIESVRGVRMLPVRSHTLPPATHTNAFLLGDDGARRVLVDPSPRSSDDMDKLLARIAEFGYDEVFLTHHHPDHRQYAETIARRAGVPIGMSADTAQRILKRQPGLFDRLQLKTYADGDELTRWLGRPVRTLAVPGHDEGHLALMPDDRSWCIVGDLIQGIGTVVVGGPEGDMAKYFASLERIIALAPKAIYPSHGWALGGTHYLEKTLQHRRSREAQIKALHEDGVAPQDMTSRIYADVDPRLLPLARINIQAHLDKLRGEGAIS